MLLLLCANVGAQPLYPGDSIPADIILPTLDPGGSFTLSSRTLVIIFDGASAVSLASWQDPQSLSDFLTLAPLHASYHYLFISNSGNAVDNAKWMRNQLFSTNPRSVASALPLHFATVTLEDLKPTNNWLTTLLQEQNQWKTPRRLFTGCLHGACTTTDQRFDSDVTWNFFKPTGVAGPMIWGGTFNENGDLQPTPSLYNGFHSSGSSKEESSDTPLKGNIILVTLTSAPANDDIAFKIAAQMTEFKKSGAILGVLIAPKATGPFTFRCSKCTVGSVEMPLTMIPFDIAAPWLEILQSATLTAVNMTGSGTEIDGTGLAVGIDFQKKLFEVGFWRMASLAEVSYAIQFQNYLEKIYVGMARSKAHGGLVVPIFKEAVLKGDFGVAAEVTLPEAAWWGAVPPSFSSAGRINYRKLEVEFRLDCPGRFDANCSYWDHLIQVFVCCEDPHGQLPPCPTCGITPWRSQLRNLLDENILVEYHQYRNLENLEHGLHLKSLSEASQHEQYPAFKTVEPSGTGCGFELARWATPYRRRVGHWLTDVSHYIPLLTSRQCKFQVQSVPWQDPWVVSMNLLFSEKLEPPTTPAKNAENFLPEDFQAMEDDDTNTNENRNAVLQSSQETSSSDADAYQVLPLPFSNATFNSTYNARMPTFHFRTPPHLSSAIITFLVSGHGEANPASCAEFCQITYHVEINGNKDHVLTFPEANSTGPLYPTERPHRIACSYGVQTHGNIPNQAGNWWFGRNGWCPGSNIRPWILDITRDLKYTGESNTIRYFALYDGKDPASEWKDSAGIWLSSNLVLYTRSGSSHAAGKGAAKAAE